MDSFDFDILNSEKAMAMRNYNRIWNITRVFRLIEIVFALVFLAWTSTRVPFAVKIAREFFAKLAGIIASPLFVFLLCNGIIATLAAKSVWFSSAENLGTKNADVELYEEIVKNSENLQTPFSEEVALSSVKEIVYQDKEIISAVKLGKVRDSKLDLDPGSDSDSDTPKTYRKSKSEKFFRGTTEKFKKELRRSETEKNGKQHDEKLYQQDELSTEEFHRRIEEFIAKQLQFRREETLSIVLPSQAA